MSGDLQQLRLPGRRLTHGGLLTPSLLRLFCLALSFWPSKVPYDHMYLVRGSRTVGPTYHLMLATVQQDGCDIEEDTGLSSS